MQQELDKIWNGWKVGNLLGEGSFGKVYRIEREEFGHTYEAALKVITIPQNQAEVKSVLNDGMDEKSATMYFRSIVEDIVGEFVLMSRLKGNSHIVSYEDHAVVAHEEGIGWTIYIRMELLTPLFDYLREHELAVRDVIQLGIDMCNALETCQKYNIIHRDIKPENIFVSDLGKFKLGDFGIARQMEKTSSVLSKKGTYTYMAPEVYKGEVYNATVDIYSLGIVLYRFLNNNRAPFLPAFPEPIRYSDKEKANVLRMGGERMPAPCNGEGRLSEIVLKACAYDPKDRYADPTEMKQALEGVLVEAAEGKFIYPGGDSLRNEKVEYVSTASSTEKGGDFPAPPVEEEEGTRFLFDDGPEAEAARRAAEKKAQERAEAEKAKQERRRREEEERKRLEREQAQRESVEKEREEKEAAKQTEALLEKADREKTGSVKKSRKPVMIASVAALLVACGIGGFLRMQREKALEREAPDFTNMTVEAAEAEAGDSENPLLLSWESEYSDTVDKGKVISQDVEAGTVLKKGDTIVVTVSKGILTAAPNLAGMTAAEAEAAVRAAKLVYQAEEAYSQEVEAGQVVTQTPAPGFEMEGQQTVNVIISKGAEETTVPDVEGKSLEKASKALTDAELEVTVTNAYSDEVKKGKVISQEVAADSRVAKHTAVGIVVSDGRDPKKVEAEKREEEERKKEEERKAAESASRKAGSSSNKSSSGKSSSKKPSSGGSSSKKPSSSKSSDKVDSIDSWDLVN